MYKNYIKRIIDLVFAVIGLPLFLFILLLVSILIYIDDQGPIFYNAPRLGKNGRIFKMFKFRTMKVNAPDYRNADGSTYNAVDDPRLTKVGKILRSASIDEIPQLLNILIGDMSFIGPRPDIPEHIMLYTEEEKRKLEVLPGVTGFNQAYYRNSAVWKKRLENDVYYVNNLTFLLDIKIIVKSLTTILFRRGVYIQKNN